jgi:hypothetical protein
MRVLIVSFYYPPDLSAGAFRAGALVEALRERLADAGDITVVTTMPNRYRAFGAQALLRESAPGLEVLRIPLPRHRSGMMDQSIAFGAFTRGVLAATRGAQYDVVFATSSRLATAVLGAWVARRPGARLYLDIRDIFADTILDVVPKLRRLHFIFSGLERWAVSRADRVNLVSPGFVGYFDARYPGRGFSCFTNGIDDEFLAAAAEGTWSAAPVADGRPVTVLYAGNVGEGQGLHRIVPQVARRLGPCVAFRVVGDGGRIRELEAAVRTAGVTNVEVCSPIDRRALIDAYAESDVLFLHLNAHPAFDKVLPSKVFEYASTGKPIWAGVSGYSAEFIRSNIPNAAVFAPCDVDAAVASFATLEPGLTQRAEFIENYTRARISRRLAEDVISLADPDR